MRRFLLYDPPVPARTAEVQKTITELDEAATRRTQVADGLVEPPEMIAALTLYREAAWLRLRILHAEGSPDAPPLPREPQAAWAAMDETLGARANKPAQLEQARAILASDDPLAADALTPEELVTARGAAQDTVRWLAGLVQPREPDTLRAMRTMRVAAVAIAVAFIVYEGR